MTMTGLKLDVGWVRFERFLSKASQQVVVKAADEATKVAALTAQKLVRNEISDGSYDANADLTLMIKGSTKPLVDKGRLFQAITNKRIKAAMYFVGILKGRGRSSGTGTDMVNIARTIHDGATIEVTSKMRGLFWSLWLATRTHYLRGERLPISKLRSKRAQELARRAFRQGNTIFPLGDNTSAIRIPSRPFIRNVFERAATKKQLQEVFAREIRKTLERLWRNPGGSSGLSGVTIG